ncbi:hypothetical protein GN956_G232 [Arapaima gigas]
MEMPIKRHADTEKVLHAMETCQSKGDEEFQVRAEKLLHIFQSDLFQDLLDIQEVYEATVNDGQDSGSSQTQNLCTMVVGGLEQGAFT